MVVHSRLLCSGRNIPSEAAFELVVDVGVSDKRGGGYKKADELCKRVFTTSNGQVTIAPTVPATLCTDKIICIPNE